MIRHTWHDEGCSVFRKNYVQIRKLWRGAKLTVMKVFGTNLYNIV